MSTNITININDDASGNVLLVVDDSQYLIKNVLENSLAMV